jgi:AraC family transcriptional regulator, activator of mtrCDE
MDILTNLLLLTPVTGYLDVHCHFGPPWEIEEPHSALQEIRYHILLRGIAIVEVADTPPIQMRAGDIVLFPAGDSHKLNDGSKQPARTKDLKNDRAIPTLTNRSEVAFGSVDILCGRFLIPALSHKLISNYLPRILHVQSMPHDSKEYGDYDEAVSDTRLRRLIQLMREETDDQGPGSQSLLNHLSGALFALTLRFASQSQAINKGFLMLAQRPRLQPALSAIFQRYNEEWSLMSLASLCNMSKATFVRHFDEALGKSSMDFLTEVRMTNAGKMLEETNSSIETISENVGYQSSAAFQRMFKKKVGLTPAQWRSNFKNKQIFMHAIQ